MIAFLYLSSCCYVAFNFSLPFPHSAVGWSEKCDCGVLSYFLCEGIWQFRSLSVLWAHIPF